MELERGQIRPFSPKLNYKHPLQGTIISYSIIISGFTAHRLQILAFNLLQLFKNLFKADERFLMRSLRISNEPETVIFHIRITV